MCNAEFFLYTAGSTGGLRTHSALYTENRTCRPVCLTWGNWGAGAGIEKTLSVTCKEALPVPQFVQLGEWLIMPLQCMGVLC